jgi:hypothetical protein
MIDVLRYPQQMAIINIVWPICALFGTVSRVTVLILLTHVGGQLVSNNANAVLDRCGPALTDYVGYRVASV